MNIKVEIVPARSITRLSRSIRDQRVILDHELAAVYGVPTKRLKEQCRRNVDCFPEDFAFRLTQDERAALRSQIAILEAGGSIRSQIATGSQQHLDRQFQPFAFVEHGALMAATVLNISRAGAMSRVLVSSQRTEACGLASRSRKR